MDYNKSEKEQPADPFQSEVNRYFKDSDEYTVTSTPLEFFKENSLSVFQQLQYQVSRS
jgi:hypothetical protein